MVWCVLCYCSSLSINKYWFAFHSVIEAFLVVMLPLRAPCPRNATYIPVSAFYLCGPPQAIWHILQFLQDWHGASCFCLVSACVEDCSAATESYLVFAVGMKSCPRYSLPPKPIGAQLYFTHILITFLFHYVCLLWARGAIEPLQNNQCLICSLGQSDAEFCWRLGLQHGTPCPISSFIA